MLSLCLFGCGRPERVASPPVPAGPPKVATQPAPPPKAPPPKPGEDEAALLVPHKVGSVWEFTVRAGGQTYKFSQRVVEEKSEGEKSLFSIEMKRDGTTVQREEYTADKTGVYRVAYGENASAKVEPPMPILKLPLAADSFWEWKGVFKDSTGETPGRARFKLTGPELVKAGTDSHQAYRVDQAITLNDPRGYQVIKNTLWFTPKIGIVKQVTGEGAESVVVELTRHKVSP